MAHPVSSRLLRLRSVAWPWLLAFAAAAPTSAALPSGCAGPSDCERNSDCDHAYCVQGECKRDCMVASVDCPEGYVCNDIGRCEGPAVGDGGLPDSSSGGSSGAGGGGVAGAGGGASGGSGNAGASQGGAGGGVAGAAGAGGGAAGTGGGVAEPLQLFDLCGQDSDCASGLVCRPMGINQAARCTRTCSASSQCMAGTRCAPVPPKKDWICAFDDDGAPCTNAGGECNDFCLSVLNKPLYCTSVCTSGAQCPAGWGCSLPIGGTRVCVRLDVPCANEYDCAGLACDPSLIVSGCSMSCTSSLDCPQRPSHLPKWSCSGGYCYRPGDVFGPASKDMTTSWACNGQGLPVNVCADGLTFDSAPALTCNEIETVNTQTDCVSSCTPTGGCGQGYACVSDYVAINGTPTAVCIRTGYAEVGQPCSKNEDCVFGVCSKAKKCSRDCSTDGVCPKGFACSAGICQ